MAVVHIAFTSAPVGGAQVEQAIPDVAEFINSTATSQATTAASRNGGIVSVTASGGDVWVAFGAAPVAAPNTHQLVPAGQTRNFGIPPGMKAAVIDRA
jgi:hypothetical protein